MSDAIFDLITREQAKAERRRANVETTKTEIEIFGDSAKLRSKLARQEAAVQESVDNLDKLNKAAGKLKK
jgi:hypothetical protein